MGAEISTELLPHFSFDFKQTYDASQGRISAITFFEICEKLKIYATWKFSLTQDHMGLEISIVTPSTVFIRSHQNFMRTLVATGEYILLLFLTIGQV